MIRRLFQPETFLRLGLGAMYLYSGIDIARHPASWYWAIRLLPEWLQVVPNSIGLDRFLIGQGIAEIVIAVIFLVPFVSRRLVKLATLFAAIEMAAIILFVGIDDVTFRDLGLLGAALALLRLI